MKILPFVEDLLPSKAHRATISGNHRHLTAPKQNSQ
jgi:hypothetical protein